MGQLHSTAVRAPPCSGAIDAATRDSTYSASRAPRRPRPAAPAGPPAAAGGGHAAG
jgi:hypothetical protein